MDTLWIPFTPCLCLGCFHQTLQLSPFWSHLTSLLMVPCSWAPKYTREKRLKCQLGRHVTLYHSYTLKGVETWIRYEKYWKILVTLCYFSITSLILSSLSWCLQFLFLTPQQRNMTDLSTSIGALLPSDFCLHAAGESAANCRHFRMSCEVWTQKMASAHATALVLETITSNRPWRRGVLNLEQQYIPTEADEGVVTFQGWLGSVQIVQSWIISETWVVSLIMHLFPVVFCWHYHWIASRKCIMITHQRVHPDAISIDKLWCLHSQ